MANTDHRNGPTARPKISFVTAVRCSEHVTGLIHRVSVFLKNIIALSNEAEVDTEVVLAEWNPDPEGPSIREVSIEPNSLGRVVVRVIVVPGEVHETVAEDGSPPFLESIAKNVGLRRALGEYRIIVNPDVVFTREVFRLFADGQLNRDAFYRIDRYDVGCDLPAELSAHEHLTICRENVVGINTLFTSLTFDEPLKVEDVDHSYPLLGELRAEYERVLIERDYESPLAEQLMVPIDGIHTNASGCFMLAHETVWNLIRGHAEFAARGHPDSVTCWSAMSAGVKQIVLQPPCLMYHQPHSRAAVKDWAKIDWRLWYKKFLTSRTHCELLLVNDENWGLADREFEEFEAAGETDLQWQRRAA